MLKTIKTTKEMRLDELIKYVWDNDVQNERFRSKESDILVVVENGRVLTEWTIDKCETFTVEVEEEITEDTVFDTLVDVNNNDEVHTTRNVSIGLYAKEQTKEIHALIDGKLQLIWEAENSERN